MAERPLKAGPDFPAFRPRVPWLGGDLQTLRNYLLRDSADLSPWPDRRMTFPMADGSGDRLTGALHQPADSSGRPLTVLIHGLTGCEDSAYIRRSSRVILERGEAVLRLNLRGAGPAQKTCRFHYHAGRSEDLATVLRLLIAEEPALCAAGLRLVGFSLGGNMLLKFLAEQGSDFPVTGAVSVSAPIDLKASQVRIMRPRNRLYHSYLLARMKADTSEAVRERVGLSPAALSRLRDIYAYDDRVVAAANGFDSADHYYSTCAAKQFVAAIAVPTLLVHARDDPWIPAAAYEELGKAPGTAAKVLLASSGGHVGFHGIDSPVPWHDRCCAAFFAAVEGTEGEAPVQPAFRRSATSIAE